MIVIEKNQAFSDSGKYIHRLNSDCYFKKCTVLSGESEANFEEVDELPDAGVEQAGEAACCRFRGGTPALLSQTHCIYR